MELNLPYGRGTVRVTGLPDSALVLEAPVATAEPIAPEQLRAVMAEKVQHPIGGPKLSQWLDGASGVTVVVPDQTRKAGQSAYLPELLSIMATRGMSRERVRILIGLGTHPQHAPESLEEVVGSTVYREFGPRGRLAESSGHVEADFELLGLTSRGTRVALHRWLCEDQPVLVTGGITYHYYAGYSGGRKGVLPGCAATPSIRDSHQLAFTTAGSLGLSGAPERVVRQPMAAAGMLLGNPMVEDQLEAVAMLPQRPFLLNTITNPHDEIIEMVAGDLIQAHTYGCTLVDQYYQVPVEHAADLVIASAGGYPSDINLIQSHKALDNAVRACAPGGTIVLLAECSQGLGNPKATDWAALGGAEAILQRLGTQFEIIGGTCEGIMRKCEQYQVRLISALPDSVARQFGFDFCSSWNGSTLDVSQYVPHNGHVAIIPAAGITMPVGPA
ncbi:MAG: nickel-dependent lactate racemase [bacterium]